MKWIDPRVKLPRLGEEIWVLLVDKYAHTIRRALTTRGSMSGETHAQLRNDELDVGDYVFFSRWDFGNKKERDDKRFNFILAWMPHHDEELPTWDFLTAEESRKCFKNNHHILEARYQIEFRKEYDRRVWFIDDLK